MEKAKHNFYQRGDGEAGGIIAIAFIALIVWGVYSSFGWGEREGVVKYDDCRSVVMLSSDTWQKFYKTFTCTYAKTQSGKVMSGECVHIDTAGTAFSASSACETAYVYEKAQDSACKGNTKDGVPYPYLGYDDKCYTTPQGGEATVSSAPSTASQTQAITAAPSTGFLPTVIGQCDGTTISKIGTRLMDSSTGQDIAGTGVAINYADGGYQVTYAYDDNSSVQDWSVGDQVNLCLVSIPTDCPPGDNRGRVYQATNVRTGESWTAQDAEHSCGGA
jgi:hypothetical protein